MGALHLYNEFDNIETRKVILDNKIILATAQMTTRALRFLLYAISKVDPKNPPKDLTVILDKEHVMSFFDIDKRRRARVLKSMMTDLHKENVFVIEKRDEKGRQEFESIAPIENLRYSVHNPDIVCVFSKTFWPYVTDLKKQFTQFPISDIQKLNTKYSIVLYQLFALYKGYYKQFKATRYKEPTISIADLRRITETTESYQQFNDFYKRVINEPITKINDVTDFTVKVRKIRRQNQVHALQFLLSWKEPKATLPYKENDKVAQEYKEQQKQQEEINKEIFLKAMQHPYTRMLIANGLLYPLELSDVNLMAQLYQNVYPGYDWMEQIKSGSVARHLSYIKEKQVPVEEDKRNIVKYLTIASGQEIQRLMTEQISNDNNFVPNEGQLSIFDDE